MKLLPMFASLLIATLLSACGGGSGGASSTAASAGASSDSRSHEQKNTQAATNRPDPVVVTEQPADTDSDYSYLKGEVAPALTISSAITGIRYPVHIYLPPGYSESNKKFPIIYALDGQWMFPGLPYLLEQEGVPAILVAISQGPENRRETDYLLPGARDYFDFLTAELIPEIESRYRADRHNRTIVGTSFGGVFAGVAMLLDDVSDPYFKNYLAFDASFYRHPELTQALENSRYQASGELNANLFLSSAIPKGNDEYVDNFESLLQNHQYRGLNITRRAYHTTHGKVAQPSFRDAVKQLLGHNS